MPRAKKKTTTKKPTTRKKARKGERRASTDRRKKSGNIVGNFRGSEDIFWKKVRDGFKKLLESPFK
tara:strand:+ start:373 stop:570 length:198 start_codon:yes stop_codon:yes gene_type:complete